MTTHKDALSIDLLSRSGKYAASNSSYGACLSWTHHVYGAVTGAVPGQSTGRHLNFIHRLTGPVYQLKICNSGHTLSRSYPCCDIAKRDWNTGLPRRIAVAQINEHESRAQRFLDLLLHGRRIKSCHGLDSALIENGT
jgi:hypothetical protein